MPATRGSDDAAVPLWHESYRSTHLRAPKHPFVPIEHTISEITGPGPAVSATTASDADLTMNAGTGSPAIGERIIVAGRVTDQDGEPVPQTLVEVWQANAAGRYCHAGDTHDAPLDPNFIGSGRCHTDELGCYRFLTVRPAAYPWKNHANAWRPAHIHFSLLGQSWVSRIVTQMYFPADPLHDLDPILTAVPERARHRLIAVYDHDLTEPEWALGYRFDIVLGGPDATPFEPTGAGAMT